MNDEQWKAFQEGFTEAYNRATKGTPMKRVTITLASPMLSGVLPVDHASVGTPPVQLAMSCAHVAGLRNLGSQAVCWECGEAFPLVEMRPQKS